MADDLSTTMDALVACATEALANIDRATCKHGLTIGPPRPGPMGCCATCTPGDDDAATAGGQVLAFLERVYPADLTREGIQETSAVTCRNSSTAADFTVVVLRCYPTMDDNGNMPTPEQTTPYAHDLNDDMRAVWNGLRCCEPSAQIRESAVDADPEGGCSAFAIRVTTMVSMEPVGDA